MYSSFKKSLVFTAITIFIFSCQKGVDKPAQPEEGIATSANNGGSGATQISGMGVYAETGECSSGGEGSSFALKLTGDLNGCLYVFIDD